MHLGQLLVQNAQSSPASTAIDTPGQIITYSEYSQRVNQLASKLQESGVGPEDRILVFFEVNENTPIAIAAIFMIGAVYVPLEPTWPHNRLSAIIEDIEPHSIITTAKASEYLPHNNSIKICLTDTFFSEQSHYNTIAKRPYEQHNAATIFYTSGTTGTPKGVVLTYANIQFYLESAAKTYKFNAEDQHLNIAKFTFSISLFDLVLPFFCGGTLVLRERQTLMNPITLAKCITSVSCFHMGPALLAALARYAIEEKIQFNHIRHVSSGGDMVPPELLTTCQQLFPNAELWVIYGCTEVACMGLTWQIKPDHSINHTYVGRPFEKSAVKLIAESGQEATIDEVGEVFFAGEGLAREYLNKKELTQQKFIVIDDKRHYASGDLALRNSQGLVRLLGRKDYQIKIRGVRIEIEEIEFWLKRVPSVIAANIVAAASSNSNEKKIVGFVVMDEKNNFSEAKIHQFINSQLPEYMLPARVFCLDAMPLNINLKIDRKKLQDLAKNNLESVVIKKNYSSPTMNEIAQYWSTSGISGTLEDDSNFFELGGDSLGAAELAFTLSKHFSTNIDINDIYTFSSLAKQATYIDDILSGKISKKKLELIVPLGKKPPSSRDFFIIPGLGGHVVTFQNINNYFSETWYPYGILYPAFIDEAYETIEEVATRMLADIYIKQQEGPYFLSGYSLGGLVALEIARILESHGKKVYLALIEVRIFELAPKKHILRRLPVYAEGKILSWVARYKNRRKRLLYNSLVNIHEGDDDEKSYPPQVQNAFSSGRQQAAQYQISPCNIPTVLIKCEQSAWWDNLRTWLDDYGWSRYLDIENIITAPGDHLGIVADKQNHPGLAKALENAFNILNAEHNKRHRNN